MIKNISNQQLGGKKSVLLKGLEKADFLRNHTVKQYIEKYGRDFDLASIVYDDIVEEEEHSTKKINELIDKMLACSSRGFSDYINYEVFKFEDPYSDKDLESVKK